MKEVCNPPRLIPKILPALCLSAVFQFVACAQATSDGSNATKTQANLSAQPSTDLSAKLIENSTPAFNVTLLSNQMLCSPNALLEIFKSTAAQPTPLPAPITEP